MLTKLAVALALSTTLAPTAPTAPALNIEGVYVAGISSGGYMADQLHIAHSATFDGAAIFAAGPYHCARGSLTTAVMACMNDFQDSNPTQLTQIARDRADQGFIDPIANLADNPVWLFHGQNDTTVKKPVTDDLKTVYDNLGSPVSYETDSPAGHAWISPRGLNACNTSTTPFINNCNDDPQSAMLTHLYGTINPPTETPSGELTTFDQNPHTPGGNAPAISMNTTGYRYTPTACADGANCRLLVALHGCKQSIDQVGTALVENAYLNEYADTNNTVVLYPQTTTSSDNPNACWNWWGYGNDPNYDTKDGKQIQAIMNMVAAQ